MPTKSRAAYSMSRRKDDGVAAMTDRDFDYIRKLLKDREGRLQFKKIVQVPQRRRVCRGQAEPVA